MQYFHLKSKFDKEESCNSRGRIVNLVVFWHSTASLCIKKKKKMKHELSSEPPPALPKALLKPRSASSSYSE